MGACSKGWSPRSRKVFGKSGPHAKTGTAVMPRRAAAATASKLLEFNLHLTVFVEAQPADGPFFAGRNPERLRCGLKLHGGRIQIDQFKSAQRVSRHKA